MRSHSKAGKRSLTWLCLLCVSLFSLMGVPGSFGTTTPSFPKDSLTLSFENHLFSAVINRVPLSKVLTRLTTQFPIRFIVKGVNTDHVISTAFTDLSFEKGLEHFLLGYDYAIIHSQGDIDDAAPSSTPDMEVVILPRDQAVQSSTAVFASVKRPQEHSALATPLQGEQNLIPQGQRFSQDSLTEYETDEVKHLLEQSLQEKDPNTQDLRQELSQLLLHGKE